MDMLRTRAHQTKRNKLRLKIPPRPCKSMIQKRLLRSVLWIPGREAYAKELLDPELSASALRHPSAKQATSGLISTLPLQVHLEMLHQKTNLVT
jgi:hypothetical protein